MNIPFLQDATFTGVISTKDYGTSENWKEVYTLVQEESGSWIPNIQSLTYTPSSYNLAISDSNSVNLSSIIVSPSANAIFQSLSAIALSGVFYGDGSNLIGASLPGQQQINTIVQTNSADWVNNDEFIIAMSIGLS